MEITITRTKQVRQYEPLTITISEKADVKTAEDYFKLKEKVTKCVEDMFITEIEKHRTL